MELRLPIAIPTNHFAKSRRRRFFLDTAQCARRRTGCNAKNIPEKKFIFEASMIGGPPTSGRRIMPASSDRLMRSKMPLPLPAFRSTNL
jgi:hypothetical protein